MLLAKFHYTGPTGPDRTRPDPCGPARTRISEKLRWSVRVSDKVRAGPVGSGRARVVEFSVNDVAANATCPGEFRRVAGLRSCYKVVSPTLADIRESRDYAQATRTCQSYGAHLVSIESIEEQRHLATVLATQPGLCDNFTSRKQ